MLLFGGVNLICRYRMASTIRVFACGRGHHPDVQVVPCFASVGQTPQGLSSHYIACWAVGNFWSFLATAVTNARLNISSPSPTSPTIFHVRALWLSPVTLLWVPFVVSCHLLLSLSCVSHPEFSQRGLRVLRWCVIFLSPRWYRYILQCRWL